MGGVLSLVRASSPHALFAVPGPWLRSCSPCGPGLALDCHKTGTTSALTSGTGAAGTCCSPMLTCVTVALSEATAACPPIEASARLSPLPVRGQSQVPIATTTPTAATTTPAITKTSMAGVYRRDDESGPTTKGAMKPGLTLIAKYKGAEHRCEVVEQDGTLRFVLADGSNLDGGDRPASRRRTRGRPRRAKVAPDSTPIAETRTAPLPEAQNEVCCHPGSPCPGQCPACGKHWRALGAAHCPSPSCCRQAAALRDAEGLDRARERDRLVLLKERLNTTVRNAGFAEKRQALEESSLMLTREAGEAGTWDRQAISARQIRLADLAVSAWPLV